MANKPSTSRYVHALLRARDWQNRPEFEALCQWWRASGVGVCALVGIGGAGKTATVDRFLQVLPGAISGTTSAPKSENLSAPEKLFVFSFYDAPNPDHFFDEIALWLDWKPGRGSSGSPSSREVLRMFETSGRCLLVLDGLEKIQDDGARGGVFGQIADRRVSDLVLRLSSGYLPVVGAIITTRFTIAELEEALYEGQAPKYLPIPVEEISLEAGVQLLKKRGVQGTQAELERIVQECGRHALTVDLAGGYLTEFENGRADAPLVIGNVGNVEDVLKREPNPRRRAVLKQEDRFAKIALRYRQALGKTDPAALALVERVCLFRLGVSANTLVSVFTGAGKEEISGPALAALNRDEVNSKLQKLVSLRLFDETDRTIKRSTKAKNEPDIEQLPRSLSTADGPNELFYTVHPAVRDGFLRELDHNTAEKGHEAVRAALSVSLSGMPGTSFISDPNTLDLIEEIIHHSIEANRLTEAMDLFRNRMDADMRCYLFGEYSRTDRIIRAITSSENPRSMTLPATLKADDQGFLLATWAFATLGLGRLSDARRCVERILELPSSIERSSLEQSKVAERDVYFLAGQIPKAKNASERLLPDLRTGGSQPEELFFEMFGGCCDFLLGKTDDAVRAFATFDDKAAELEESDREDLSFGILFFRGELRAHILMRLNERARAQEWCESALENVAKQAKADPEVSISETLPRVQLALAECLFHEHPDQAEKLLDDAGEWAILRDSKELLCLSALVRGRLKRSEAVRQTDVAVKTELLKEALRSFEESVFIARDCGFGLYHIDIMVERAQVHLLRADPVSAISDLRVALTDGFTHRAESGLPTLLAALNDECGYAWGAADCHHLLGRALMLHAAQLMHRLDFSPSEVTNLPSEIQTLLSEAESNIGKCLALRTQIRDPNATETEKLQDELRRGILGNDPSLLTVKPESKINQPTSITRSKVFLSYSREDKKIFGEFKKMLAPAIRKGTVDLWDDTMIKPGANWQDDIKAGIAAAKVGMLLVSPDFLASDFIAKNELPPLLKAAQAEGVTIFWALLSPCLHEETEIAQYQAAHDVGRPLDSLKRADRKAAIKDICDRLIQVVTQSRTSSLSTK